MSDERPPLTKRQVQILRWLDENPSHRARWLVEGRDPRRGDAPDSWNQWEISGRDGSIRMSREDNLALRGLIMGCPSADKIYGPSDAGRSLLAAEVKLEGAKL